MTKQLRPYCPRCGEWALGEEGCGCQPPGVDIPASHIAGMIAAGGVMWLFIAWIGFKIFS